jgi:hypothetical protein
MHAVLADRAEQRLGESAMSTAAQVNGVADRAGKDLARIFLEIEAPSKPVGTHP